MVTEAPSQIEVRKPRLRKPTSEPAPKPETAAQPATESKPEPAPEKEIQKDYFTAGRERYQGGVNVKDRTATEYYQKLLGSSDKYFNDVVTRVGYGYHGDYTVQSARKAEAKLGLEKTGKPSEELLYGLELARQNNGVITEEIGLRARIFRDLLKDERKVEGPVNFKAIEDKTEAIAKATQGAMNIAHGVGAKLSGMGHIKDAPFGHIFIMAQEGFDCRLQEDVGGKVIGFGTQHRANDNGTVTRVSALYGSRETITPGQGYELVKPMIERKTEMCRENFPNFDKLAPNKQDALISLAYNLKDNTLEHGLSHLKDALKNNDMERAATCIELCYIKSNPIHKERRKQEADLFRGKDPEVIASKLMVKVSGDRENYDFANDAQRQGFVETIREQAREYKQEHGYRQKTASGHDIDKKQETSALSPVDPTTLVTRRTTAPSQLAFS